MKLAYRLQQKDHPKVIPQQERNMSSQLIVQKQDNLQRLFVAAVLFAVLVTPLSSIFARKRMQERLLGTDSTGYHACTDYGWINGEAFLHWIQFFAVQGRQAATR
jgi:hypothetical protein